MTERRDCLLVDFGGVLTTNVFSSFAAFCTSHGLDADAVVSRFRDDEAVRTLLVELETGRMAEAEFETRFGEQLGVEADGLIDRLFAQMLPDEAMIAAVAAAREAGIRTGLISNSWTRRHYDEQLLAELFDALVISGEVGVRKPDPGIYELALERVGRPARRCVFVDDLPGNLKPARELGMATVHHRAAETTLPELEELLGIRLPDQDEKR